MTYTCIGISENDPVCINCKHFHRHYVYDEQRRGCVPIYLGHCACGRIKNRRVQDTCEHFTKGSSKDYGTAWTM